LKDRQRNTGKSGRLLQASSPSAVLWKFVTLKGLLEYFSGLLIAGYQ